MSGVGGFLRLIKSRLGGAVFGLMILVGVLGAFSGVALGGGEVFADTVETNLFGNVDTGENGEGVYTVLNIALTIMTYGVMALGVIGMVIAGIMYLTARDNEAQMAKAKTRIFEIVIGLAVWAVMYAALQFLLPGFE